MLWRFLAGTRALRRTGLRSCRPKQRALLDLFRIWRPQTGALLNRCVTGLAGSLRENAAVHSQDASGHPGAVFGGKERDRTPDITRRGHLGPWMQLFDYLGQVEVSNDLVQGRLDEVSGRDRVDVDEVRGEFDGERTGHGMHRALGRGVATQLGLAYFAGDGSDVDDV